MALVARLSLAGPPSADPEDYLASALGVIFTDDVTNQHGDAEHALQYTSPHLPKPLHIALADATAEDDRKLFSHFLWNASLLLAEFVEAATLGRALGMPLSIGEKVGTKLADFDVKGLTTLEIGAGTALPSILAALTGAQEVFVTDYPSPVVIKMLQQNVSQNTADASFSPIGSVSPTIVEGHSWGELDTPFAREHAHSFDRIFVCDCLWMPWQHANLHKSISWFMKDGDQSRAWVIAGFHTGREKMRGFFDAEALAAEGLETESIWERDCDGLEREWVTDLGREDVSVRKRWLVVGVLRRTRAG